MDSHLSYICKLEHGREIRSIGRHPLIEGGFLTGDKDGLIKSWIPAGVSTNADSMEEHNDKNEYYQLEYNFIGHEAEVMGIIVLDKETVVSCSYDKSIIIWDYKNPGEIKKRILGAHTDRIHAISPLANGGFITCGFDKCANIWDAKGEHVKQLGGFDLPILGALELPNGDIVIGGAEAHIGIYRDGKCLKWVEKAHELAIRGFILIPNVGFGSYGNDGKFSIRTVDGDEIKSWNASNTFLTHAFLTSDSLLVTTSEDLSIRIWNLDGKMLNKIMYPRCVWEMLELPNGRIGSASSSGDIYIFSRNPNDKPIDSDVTEFEAQIKKEKENYTKTFIKVDELVKVENLASVKGEPNQQKLVNEGGKPVLYMYDASKAKWERIGEAFGEQDDIGGNEKEYFEGTPYDRVFRVEIDDGRTLAFGYNYDQDYWVVADKVVAKYQLEKEFRDNIASFIREKTGGKYDKLHKKEKSIVDPYQKQEKLMLERNAKLRKAETTKHIPCSFSTFSPTIQAAGMQKAIVKISTLSESERNSVVQAILADGSKVDSGIRPIADKLLQVKEFVGLDCWRHFLKSQKFRSSVLQNPNFDQIVNKVKENRQSYPTVLTGLMVLLEFTRHKEFASIIAPFVGDISSFVDYFDAFGTKKGLLLKIFSNLLQNVAWQSFNSPSGFEHVQEFVSTCVSILKLPDLAENVRYNLYVSIGTYCLGSEDRRTSGKKWTKKIKIPLLNQDFPETFFAYQQMKALFLNSNRQG